ncbi:zinc-binding dehydrogenase [Paractinoplanes durhamensis]|uniref:Alcohol dehydrogenase-like C-terminal domain-containing protein n=1 Tax=Paractinoplanes durhamensis TaxID=113563 RepID=A0ABQ3YWM0_9ACTN|nr:zinc-binding dehydrogenase [Actinoplanes durhamensis]GIE01981.1 hypothetical protein Adu01nite_33310 [Actinoplanes durhamensis]
MLILGATGSAGRMAIQIAKLFGAARVIAAGRDTARLATLAALGADETITFDKIDRAADADVVLDYVWGEASAQAMLPLLTARADRGAPMTWIQIGSMAGELAAIPSVALRGARLQIVGSGIGSIAPRDFMAELPALAEALATGRVDVQAHAVPLNRINQAWTAETGDRLVFIP